MRTAILAAAIAAVLAWLGPALDAIDDRSAEWDQARDLEDAQRAAAARHRFERAAQRMCGSQAAWREVGDGIVQCLTKRGRPTIRAAVSP